MHDSQPVEELLRESDRNTVLWADSAYTGPASYRVEVRASTHIGLKDEDLEIRPVPTRGGRRKPEPELEQLSNIIRAFNDQFGNIDWKDADKIRQVIAEEITTKIKQDEAYQNAAKNSDKQNRPH